jgi:hypothetical protein
MVCDISEEVGLSMRQIYRYLRQENTESQCSISLHSSREVVVLMDAMYWGRHFGVVIFQDNTDGTVLWYKFIDKKESVGDYEEGLKHLLRHGIKINGIVSDGLIGLRERMIDYHFQYCQFHQLLTILKYLTKNPKTEAGRSLLALTRQIFYMDKESFIGAFNEWQEQWHDFLKERSEPTKGKRLGEFKHKRLRSAWRSVRRNMPWLWTFYDYPDLGIPNTNNALERLNGIVKDLLRRHRGISLEKRKQLIATKLNTYKPHRNK